MSATTVLVTDHPWPSTAPEEEILGAVGARMVFAASGEEQELVELAAGADAILTCFARVTGPVVQAAPGLQVIGRYGIGVDNIAVAEATQRGILVTNTPSYCTDEVAEHTIALMLSLGRRTVAYDRAVHAGDWSMAAGQPMHRIAGQTVGIIGFGEIGRAVARRALALGLSVIAHHPRRGEDELRAAGAEPVSLDDLARRADFVTLHVPLTDATRGLVDVGFLRAMKPSAFLVNTARGAVIDQEALARALRERWIAGAAVDVVVPERLPPDHPLLGLPNLIVTPHVAYYSEESLLALGRLAAENVAAVLAGTRPASMVNPEVLALARWSRLAAAG
ncbi:MAG: C-terminal binding protein [Solirubrobacteraceae bacterium]